VRVSKVLALAAARIPEDYGERAVRLQAEELDAIELGDRRLNRILVCCIPGESSL
jgi:hypothetical protein